MIHVIYASMKPALAAATVTGIAKFAGSKYQWLHSINMAEPYPNLMGSITLITSIYIGVDLFGQTSYLPKALRQPLSIGVITVVVGVLNACNFLSSEYRATVIAISMISGVLGLSFRTSLEEHTICELCAQNEQLSQKLMIGQCLQELQNEIAKKNSSKNNIDDETLD